MDLDAKSVSNTPMQDYLHDILMELREQNIKQQTIMRRSDKDVFITE